MQSSDVFSGDYRPLYLASLVADNRLPPDISPTRRCLLKVIQNYK